jgi:hypothetical protein
MSSPVGEWAKANGYPCGDRGRLSDDIITAWDNAHPQPQVETPDDMGDQLWVQVNIPGQSPEVEETVCTLLLGILIAAGYGAAS